MLRVSEPNQANPTVTPVYPEIELQGKILVIRGKGNLELSSNTFDTEDTIKRVFVQLTSATVTHLLFDFSETCGKLSMVRRFNFVELFTRYYMEYIVGKQSPFKIAYLANRDQWDEIEFIETVAFNRGLEVKGFKTRQELQSWLPEESASRPRD